MSDECLICKAPLEYLETDSKLISDIPDPDVVITMGCNVQCPNIPCKKRLDLGLDDPTDKSDEEFIKTANKIKEKILELRGQ